VLRGSRSINHVVCEVSGVVAFVREGCCSTREREAGGTRANRERPSTASVRDGFVSSQHPLVIVELLR